MFSTFDIYKIGIGPSSSHTVGPMKAARGFIDTLEKLELVGRVDSLRADVYGSLSLTGRGHHTDSAILLGLMGNSPETVDIDAIPAAIAAVNETETLWLACGRPVHFGRDAMVFHPHALPKHENAMTLSAFGGGALLHSVTYYSVGGGFVVEEADFGKTDAAVAEVPFPFENAEQLIALCRSRGVCISTLMLANEKALHCEESLYRGFREIWLTMKQAIERGCHTEGILAGPLRVPRRAPALLKQLESSGRISADPMEIVDWVNLFALAVSEENAAGGRVVTAPTNGAAGIIPAVMAYFDKFIQPLGQKEYSRFLLASAAIGGLYKRNASISGAEVGCQGEVGVACSMAAAGLAELMGASPAQVCMAAEIAMEHNLGLTCDPVAGQVQVPCIERNAIAAVKAVNAARMALRRTSDPRVSLDKVIATMYETGKDMHAKYRETSLGGLAIKVTSICD
ncbi:L-serine ammonia-lyase [Shewanella sp. JM162201]|uniref:L-serine dehydratase n=1 Tax=Shewanella jiangmenensis TaxID=2837387 RepID=A0ABS5UZG5_9GAMM|nr:L-serine ammonia-lyase [Shewanella jiangmenensis]MBT1443586.1 L-serine ammonia-lyase [Shewanella jiangmenensis]